MSRIPPPTYSTVTDGVAYLSDYYRTLAETDQGTARFALRRVRDLVQLGLAQQYPSGNRQLERPGTYYSTLARKSPFVPWVSAGMDVPAPPVLGKRSWTPKDIYMLEAPVDLRGGTRIVGATMFTNIQWSADGRDVYVVLLPYASHWHKNRTLKRLDIDWTIPFKRIRDEVRKLPTIARLGERGFVFDDNVDLGKGIEQNRYRRSMGSQMQRGYVVSKHFPRQGIPDDASFVSDIKALVDAYSVIATSWPLVDAARRDIEDNAIVFEF